MKKETKLMILSVALCLLPILLGLYLWNDLPDMVPTHFDFSNQPDQYSSKAFAVFGIPAIMAGLDALCFFGMRSDPRRARQSEKMRKLFVFFIPLLSCLLVPITFLIAMGRDVNIGRIITVLLGVLFLVIGNYLPKCHRNYTMGIKLPWTLADDNNWNYTHRIGGVCFMIGGVCFLLTTFFKAPWLPAAAVAQMILVPFAASYFYYRRHKGEENE